MTTTINASTSAGLVQTADTSGVLALQTAGTTAVTISSGQVATFAQAPVLPAASIPQAALAANVAGNGPAFSAYLSANQNLTASTYTKVTINTKDFDTNSNYDNSTNYRFTPTIAGYYQVNVNANFNSTGVNPTNDITLLYKNGSEIKRVVGASATSSYGNTLSSLIYMNGSTDYLEMYVFYSGGTGTVSITGGTNYTYFSASMVRSA